MSLVLISFAVLIGAFAVPAAASMHWGVDSRKDQHLNW
jgi:hypothetical protein